MTATVCIPVHIDTHFFIKIDDKTIELQINPKIKKKFE